MDSKQAEHHCPQLIRDRAMKKKMIHRFPTPFTHIAPIDNYNFSSFKDYL